MPTNIAVKNGTIFCITILFRAFSYTYPFYLKLTTNSETSLFFSYPRKCLVVTTAFLSNIGICFSIRLWFFYCHSFHRKVFGHDLFDAHCNKFTTYNLLYFVVQLYNTIIPTTVEMLQNFIYESHYKNYII